MITLSSLAKDYGAQILFRDVSLQLNSACRYGLVGANGSGKTTLLRLLTNQEESSSGSIAMPKRLRLGVLEQDHFQYENDPILQVAMRGHAELWNAIQEKEKVLEEDDFDADRYSKLEDIILRLDGYSFEARAGEILEGLGIPSHVHDQPLSTLSGGFKLRVLLAQTLAAEPDCLLLDEPTNHLDILSIRWLEKHLTEFPGCVIVISHDHRFLDNVTTHILDVDYETISPYTGNYTAFVKAKKVNRDRKEAEISKQEKEIAHHRAFAERFKAKATKARQAQSKLKRIDKIVVDNLPQSSRRFPIFRFQQLRPSGKKALELEGLEKSFDENRVLTDVSLYLHRGDRMAIIGPNGIGKSTLLKIIVNDIDADAGTIDWGHETHLGYFPQSHQQMLGERSITAEQWIEECCPGRGIGFVRGLLGRVLFSGEEVEKKIQQLSGGEAARLIFARLEVDQPNVLLLDEPTNHLDLEAIEALVKALENYEGTLIFVSHDRWFVSRLATRVLELMPDGINDFQGTYDDYLAQCGDDHLDADTAVLRQRRERRREKSREPSKRSTKPANGTVEQQRKQKQLRRDVLTAGIEEAERRIEEIDGRFCESGFFENTAADTVKKMQQERHDLRSKVDELMVEWESIEQELETLS
ncbi:MAG: ABC-F family ATP-binding cassette domain-containing protein [bacterium]|nr:ABC-F family ATP-binding cassette domain-containing protein [bacterium]